jgi:hypothetical protein
MVVNGLRLELGARLLELSYGREGSEVTPPLYSYRPGPSGHRPYIAAVRHFLTGLLGSDLLEVDQPRMFVNGATAPDIYFTVDLVSLCGALTRAQREAMTNETRRILDEADDAGVLASTAAASLWTMSLEAASLANHGPTFHQLFLEGVCQKILPEGSSAVVAALRRKVWMPLFHPRTLWEAVSGGRVGFVPERRFHTVAGGGTGEVVRRLVARLEAAPNVTVTRVPTLERVERCGHGVRLQFAGGGAALDADRPILGYGPEQLFPAAGVPYSPKRLPVGICWVTIPETDVLDLASTTLVVDDDLPAYRVNDGGEAAPGARLVSVELSHHVDLEGAAAAARRVLEVTGVLRPGGATTLVHHVRAPAFTAPNAANCAAFATARESFNDLGLDADIVGGAASFGADSLNEQVVQGLRAGEMVE